MTREQASEYLETVAHDLTKVADEETADGYVSIPEVSVRIMVDLLKQVKEVLG